MRRPSSCGHARAGTDLDVAVLRSAEAPHLAALLLDLSLRLSGTALQIRHTRSFRANLRRGDQLGFCKRPTQLFLSLTSEMRQPELKSASYKQWLGQYSRT